MPNTIWLVAKREFSYNLRRPTFLFTAFGTPLIIFGIWVLIFLVEGFTTPEDSDFTTFGYVDNAAIWDEPTVQTLPIDRDDPEAGEYVFIPFADVDAARAALDAEEIDGFYVVPPEYVLGEVVERVSYEVIPGVVDRRFNEVLTVALGASAGVDPILLERLANPVRTMDITLLDSGRRFSQEGFIVLIFLPMVFGIIFFMAAQTTSQFLMTGLVEEKQNRIIEILVTTIKPMELLSGKVLGLGLLGLLQFGVWVGLAALIFLLAPFIDALSFLADITLPVDMLFVGFIYFVLSYFILASALSAVGVLVGSEEQSSMFVLIFMIPIYFVPLFSLGSFFTDADGAYVTFISIFPLTSPLSMMFRMGFAFVPLWQILLGGVLLVVTTIITAWFSARLFHWGLLLYGKKITPREILSVMFGGGGNGNAGTQKEGA